LHFQAGSKQRAYSVFVDRVLPVAVGRLVICVLLWAFLLELEAGFVSFCEKDINEVPDTSSSR
jgi:hypothetical protein